MSSVSSLQTLVDWINIGVFISLVLSFAFGGTSILLGIKLGRLKDAQAEAAQKKFELDLATQQERAAKAERELLEVQERMKPWHFGQRQEADFLAALNGRPKSKGKVEIGFTGTDVNGQRFAMELLLLLTKKAGWAAKFMSGLASNHGRGITIGVKDADHPPPAAVALREALEKAGFESVLKGWDFADPEMIWVEIGERF